MGSDNARYAGVGFQFGAAIIAFALLGWWLDKKLGTGPWLLILGVILGFAGGMISLLKKVPPVTGGHEHDV
jgi:F0F1-type ATP synthase assembly protein I